MSKPVQSWMAESESICGSLFSLSYAETCAEIHAQLARLPEYRFVKDVPFENGLYFWFQQDEICSHDPHVSRIVRVGNHPHAQDGLKNRLRNHYSGTKNGSVFRKLIGGALLRQQDPSHSCLAPSPGLGHWEKQDGKCCEKCRGVEREVSTLLKEKFFFKCVRIDDQPLRNYLERVIIRDLSHCPSCRASADWLGRYAYNTDVRNCGMWNSEFTFGPLSANDGYVDTFRMLVAQTLANPDTKMVL